MQLGNVNHILLAPCTATLRDAERVPAAKKRREKAPDEMDIPLAAYHQVVIQRRDNAHLQQGLPAKDKRLSVHAGVAQRSHTAQSSLAVVSMTAGPSALSTSLTRQVNLPVQQNVAPLPVTAVKKKAEALPLTQPAPITVKVDTPAHHPVEMPETKPQAKVSAIMDNPTASGQIQTEDRGKTESTASGRRNEPDMALVPRQLAGLPDAMPSLEKTLVPAEPASRAFRSTEMMRSHAQAQDPLARGETRISWTFRRWQPAGDQSVRISLLPDAAAQMIMVPSTREVGERLDLARFAEGAPDFVLRDEHGHEQGRRQGEREQAEEDEV